MVIMFDYEHVYKHSCVDYYQSINRSLNIIEWKKIEVKIYFYDDNFSLNSYSNSSLILISFSYFSFNTHTYNKLIY